MRIILSPSRARAERYARDRRLTIDKRPDFQFVDRPQELQDACPSEVHVLAGFSAHRNSQEILEALLRCEDKMPLRALWWWNGRIMRRDEVLDILGVGVRA